LLLPLPQPHLRDLLHGAHHGLEALHVARDTQSERLQAGLASLTPEALEQPMPGPDSNGELTETLRSLLTIILFHQIYHAGQMGVLRRIVGKPGAIP
jgi:uncharacterized damage-inducible protein DinB